MNIGFPMWFSRFGKKEQHKKNNKEHSNNDIDIDWKKTRIFHMKSLIFESDCKWKQIFIVSSGFKCIISFVI